MTTPSVSSTPKAERPNFDHAKQLAEANYRLILEDLGLEIDRYGDSKGCCPAHGGDNPRAFSYCSKRHTWLCFTHKCNEKSGAGILGLIKEAKGCTWTQMIAYVEDICGQKIGTLTPEELELRRFINVQKQQTLQKVKYVPRAFPPDVLKNAERDYSYFLGRGVSEKMLVEFDNFVCTNSTKPLANRSCFPLHDDEGEIIGFAGRSLDSAEPKWKFECAKKTTNSVLFNLNRAKDHIRVSGTAIVVEGFLDNIKLWELGYLNTVSSFGVDLHLGQRDLLLKYGAKRLIIAYDPDPAGTEGAERICRKNKLMFDCVDLTPIIPAEPADLSAEQIEEYFGEYR